MNAADENLVVATIERSALAGAIERAGLRLRRLAEGSALLARAIGAYRGAAARPGITLLAAVVTHLVLQAVFARPAFWYWLIIPAIFATAAAVLIVAERPSSLPRD